MESPALKSRPLPAFWKRPLQVAGVLVLLLALFCGFVFGMFNSHAVCEECGRERHTLRHQIPLFDLTYWTSHTEAETPLSRAATEQGLVGPHDHRWLFSTGAGNGVTCAIGPGRYLREATESPLVVTFFRDLERYEGLPTARIWLRVFLDKRTSRLAVERLQSDPYPYPEAGFATERLFREWWESRAVLWSNSVRWERGEYESSSEPLR